MALNDTATFSRLDILPVHGLNIELVECAPQATGMIILYVFVKGVFAGLWVKKAVCGLMITITTYLREAWPDAN